MKSEVVGSGTYSQAVLWLPPFFVMAGIFVASSSAIPAMIKHLIPYQDKVAHLLLFGVLAFLLSRAAGFGWGWSWGRAAFFAIIATSIYGFLDEWHQSYVPGRTVDIADWAADTLGAALAQFPAYFFVAKRVMTANSGERLHS
jgi:VanZ family protein